MRAASVALKAGFRTLGSRAALRIGVWTALCVALGAPAPCADFVRGDADGDGVLAISDAVVVLQHLSAARDPGLRCLDAADADDSGALNVTDAIYVLSSLFQGGATPPAPFPVCGADTTEDGLSCESHESCPPTLYGLPILGDGVFFVVDCSGSMADSGELTIAKREAIRVINDLPEDHWFGVVFFASDIRRFPADGAPTQASAAMKDAATAFIQATVQNPGTCVKAGLLEGLGMAKASGARRKVLVYVGDGGGTCGGNDEATYLRMTLEGVAEANRGQVQIHAVGVLSPSALGVDFMQRLARDNSGIYTRIDR